MNTVEPIRDRDALERVKQIARARSERDYMLIFLGINCGQRISDLSRLRVGDVSGGHIDKREKKTGKERKIYLNGYVREELAAFIAGRGADEFLFESRQRTCAYPQRRQAALARNEARQDEDKRAYADQAAGIRRPITRQRAYQIINAVCRAAGVPGKVGNHTLRKTFGYWHHQQFRDIALLMDIFGHSDQSITFRYIGMTQEWHDWRMQGFRL